MGTLCYPPSLHGVCISAEKHYIAKKLLRTVLNELEGIHDVALVRNEDEATVMTQTTQ